MNIIKRPFVALIMLTLCAVLALWSMLVVVCSVLFGSGTHAWTILQSYDQLANVLIGGDQDEWISARAWRLRLWHPRWARAVKVIDFVFLHARGEANHCEKCFRAEHEARMRPYRVHSSS